MKGDQNGSLHQKKIFFLQLNTKDGNNRGNETKGYIKHT